MSDDYRILFFYKTKQYDECLKLCDEALKFKRDRMIEFVQMRAMTLQVKMTGNGYEEVDYFSHKDDIVPTAVAKTPRPGTSFNKENAKVQRTPANVS